MVIVIGHRGAMNFAPENTISSFKKAIELKADMIELDVHLTKDNHVVVIHDKTVNRTTDGKGEVNKLTLKEVKRLNIKKDEKVPSLQEAIDLIKGRCKLNIEVKDPNALKHAIYLVENNNIEKDVIISSFLQDIVEESKKINPKIKTAMLFVNPDIEFLEYAKKIKVYSLHTHHATTNEKLIKRAKEFGLKVHAWGADDKKSFTKMIDLGVDGVITNNPGLR